MLDIYKRKPNFIELHLGAYFRGSISTLAGVIATITLASILVIFFKEFIEEPGLRFWAISSLCILLGIFANIFFGIEGVEFDLEKRTFRKYVKRHGIKFGEWKLLAPYTMLCLSAQYNSIGRSPLTSLDKGKNRSLEINLASLTQNPILLAECKNYKTAENVLTKLNSFLNLEIKNFLLEHYQKSSPKR